MVDTTGCMSALKPDQRQDMGFIAKDQALGHECMVVAPALIPKRSGERIKNESADKCGYAWRGCIGPAN